MHDSARITEMVNRGIYGDKNDFRNVYDALVEKLKVMVRLRKTRRCNGLRTTQVVDEFWMGLLAAYPASWKEFDCREKFYAYAATTIRNIICDVYRHETAGIRGGKATFEPLDPIIGPAIQSEEIDLETQEIIDLVLAELELVREENPNLHALLIGKIWLEKTSSELAEEFGVSQRTVSRAFKKFVATTMTKLRQKVGLEENESIEIRRSNSRFAR